MYAHVTALPLARSGNPQLKYTAGQMPDLQNRMYVNNREMKRRKPVCRNPPLGSIHFVLRDVPLGKSKTLNIMEHFRHYKFLIYEDRYPIYFNRILR